MLENFEAVDHGRIEPVRPWPSLALDVAQTEANPLELNIAGNNLYLSDDTTGKIYIRFNSKEGARIPLQAGASVSGLLFRRIYLDWEAQAGLIADLLYATGIKFAPSNDVANIGSIGSITNPVTIAGGTPELPTTGYYRKSNSAALGTIVTPAANTAGVDIFHLGVRQNAGVERIMVKTSAPSSVHDTAALTLLFCADGGAGKDSESDIPVPVRVPAGYGIYEQSDNAAAFSIASMIYEVLA